MTGEATQTMRCRIFDITATVAVTGAAIGGSVALSHFGFSLGTPPLWTYLGIQILMFACFLPLERLAPIGPNKSMDSWLLNIRLNVVFAFVGTIIGALVVGPSISVLSRHIGLGLIDLRFAAGRGAVGLLGAFLSSIFIIDVCFYWYHRLMHKVPFLWQVHKIHHIDTHLDATSNNRENWLDTFFSGPLIAIPPAVLFKMDPYQIGLLGTALGFFQTAWPTFYHSNIRVQFGWASVLINCHQVHRIHHSRLPQHRDRNFAGFFPLLDVIFGTYTAPVRNEFPPTGVEGEREVRSLMEASALPLREWVKMLRAWYHRHDFAQN